MAAPRSSFGVEFARPRYDALLPGAGAFSPLLKNVPSERNVGAHRPIKMPVSFLPVAYM